MEIVRLGLTLLLMLPLVGCGNTLLTYHSRPQINAANEFQEITPTPLRKTENILRLQDLTIWPIFNNHRFASGGQYVFGIRVETFKANTTAQEKPFVFVVGFKAPNRDVQILPYATMLSIGDHKLTPKKVSLIVEKNACLGAAKASELSLKQHDVVDVKKMDERLREIGAPWQCLRFEYDVQAPEPTSYFQMRLKYSSDTLSELDIYFVPTLIKHG